MKTRTATSQEQLDQIIADGDIAKVESGLYMVSSGAVQAWGSATVEAGDSATVEAWGSATVRAWGSATVEAWGSATVEAWGSATVRAGDSATVEAWDSATVRAGGSATVRAWGSATVEAWDSATVRAWGSATVEASGVNTVVQQHSPNATVTARNLIVVRQPDTPQAWADNYGVTVEDGQMVVYKAVNDDYTSPRGFAYTPGSVPVAADWDGGVAECGGGLHFSPRPFMAKEFHRTAARFIAVPVALDDCRTPDPSDRMPQKIKARGACGPVWEVDVDGNRIGGDE